MGCPICSALTQKLGGRTPTRKEVVAQVANSQNKCFSWSWGTEESKKAELGKYASPLAAYGKAKDHALPLDKEKETVD